jgi:hypothetical protein
MPKTIYLTNDDADNGINITWTPSRQQLYISGWFDSFVGIEGKSMFLIDFFTELGITEKDCIKAFKSKNKTQNMKGN